MFALTLYLLLAGTAFLHLRRRTPALVALAVATAVAVGALLLLEPGAPAYNPWLGATALCGLTWYACFLAACVLTPWTPPVRVAALATGWLGLFLFENTYPVNREFIRHMDRYLALDVANAPLAVVLALVDPFDPSPDLVARVLEPAASVPVWIAAHLAPLVLLSTWGFARGLHDYWSTSTPAGVEPRPGPAPERLPAWGAAVLLTAYVGRALTAGEGPTSLAALAAGQAVLYGTLLYFVAGVALVVRALRAAGASPWIYVSALVATAVVGGGRVYLAVALLAAADGVLDLSGLIAARARVGAAPGPGGELRPARAPRVGVVVAVLAALFAVSKLYAEEQPAGPPRIEPAVAAGSTGNAGRPGMVRVPVGDGAFLMDRHEHPNRAGRVPTRLRSWAEAGDRCREAGKRLCTVAEWQWACERGEIARYRASCNLRPDHGPAPGAPPHSAPGGTVLEPSGSRPVCVSEDGVADLVGNVWELAAPEGQPYLGAVGGYFRSVAPHASCHHVLELYPSQWESVGPDRIFGFRCCASERAAASTGEPLGGR